MENTKLQSRDLITIGIFNAIMVVIMFISAIISSVPVMFPFYVVWPGLFNGIIFLLMYSKVPKRGTFLITCIIQILLMVFGWRHISVMIPPVIAGIIGEIILSNHYKDAKRIKLCYIIFVTGLYIGGFGALFIMKEWYIETFIINYYDSEFLRIFVDAMFGWVGIVSAAATVVAGLAGVNFGSKLMKKHFKKAGIV